jgi:hypothetical protein
VFDPDHEWIIRIHAEIQAYTDAQHRLRLRSEQLDVPTPRMLAEMLEVAFWASLTTNEGRPTRVRMAMVQAGSVDSVLAFKRPIPYAEPEITMLAPAAAATGWLAVDGTQSPGMIWGISRQPIHDRTGVITLDISDPGVIRVGLGPYQSFVVFAGRSAASQHATRDLALTARLQTALGKDPQTSSRDEADSAWRECEALGMLARMVLEDRHGGTLLVVPDSNGTWLGSLNPFTHEYLRPDSSIRESIPGSQRPTVAGTRALTMLERSDLPEHVRGTMLAAIAQANWQPEGLLRPIARLAAVDGAVVLTSGLDVLGFGAMINVATVPDVYVAGSWPERVDRINIEEAGGTRHQSAIRFVGHNRASIALVISHDGHLALVHWSPEHDGVLLLKNAEWWI